MTHTVFTWFATDLSGDEASDDPLGSPYACGQLSSLLYALLNDQDLIHPQGVIQAAVVPVGPRIATITIVTACEGYGQYLGVITKLAESCGQVMLAGPEIAIYHQSSGAPVVIKPLGQYRIGELSSGSVAILHELPLDAADLVAPGTPCCIVAQTLGFTCVRYEIAVGNEILPILTWVDYNQSATVYHRVA